MILINSAIVIADTGEAAFPFRKLVLIYPACFEYGLKAQCEGLVEMLEDERYDEFWYTSTLFNVDTFYSDFLEILRFESRIRKLFENTLHGSFVNILNFKNSPIIEEIEEPLLRYDFPKFLLKVDRKLGPLV